MLLVQDDPRAAAMIVEMLHAVWPDGLLVTQTRHVADAVQELAERHATCVLLELPAGSAELGLDALAELSAAAPEAAIIVLAEHGDEELGLAAVKAGAQDHLLKAELTPAQLARSIRYAVERKGAEVRLSHQALHDPLTELPNRLLFLDRLSVAMDRARRIGLDPAIMFLDVDGFKAVNDTLGHAAGDALLTVLAARFRSLLRPMDTVARIGGDEFTFLFEGLSGEAEAVAIAQRISDAASEPVALGAPDGDTSVTVSIGIAMADDPAALLDDVIRDADAAMYRAKDLGGDRAELFDEGSRRRVVQRITMEDALRTAIQSSQLQVHYQPRVSIDGETGLAGFEALVRWDHPERGLIAPAEFMPLAEETGLVVPLGDWVLERALGQVNRWRQSRPGMTISVNVSRRQLTDPGLMARLTDTLARGGADPSVLWLEVAEDAVVHDPEDIVGALEGLRALGIRLAIDDFGFGRSSLQSLRRLPVDMLKIHQSFVSRLGRDAGSDEAVVGAVVDLGHALGLSVIAEGVETDTQLAHLRDLGCDGAQGYLFSQPVPEASVRELLGTG